jgi:hypothetical protein
LRDDGSVLGIDAELARAADAVGDALGQIVKAADDPTSVRVHGDDARKKDEIAPACPGRVAGERFGGGVRHLAS